MTMRLRVAGAIAAAFAVVSCLVLVFDGDDPGGGPAKAAPTATRVTDGVPVADEENEPAEDPDLSEGFVSDDTEPEVQPYATELSGRVHTPRPAPSAPPTVGPGNDGCDHTYGEVGQCVPWDFPAEANTTEERCAWLRELGFEPPIASRGDDRHGLDPDDDGRACAA